MSLFSLYFYILFIIVLICTVLISKLFPNKKTLHNLLLLFASFVFIAYSSWIALVIILTASFITWFCGKQKNKVWQYIGITLLIFVLIFYKYADANHMNIIIPLGVSFFTFSAISYLADILKNEYKSSDFLHVALYLSFFPKLTSGPLQKASAFFEQIDNQDRNKNISYQNLSEGLQIYFFGLFKKLVLADRLSVFINEVYATPAAFSGLSILLAIISYSLQIYFDFSGYSDMAIGTGKMLGFDLPKNFNMPYLAQNVTEFWRRWHISLSTWIRNYIYIPLGGNRKGKIRQNINLLIAMTLCGLWHGAPLNFILWGFLHGVALLVHKQFSRICKINNELCKVISIFFTFIFVSLLWVLFRADNISAALLIYHRLFLLSDGLNQPYFWSFINIAIFVVSIVIVIIFNKGEGFYPILNLRKIPHLTLFFVFLGLLLCLCYTGGSPFIYGAF